MFVKFRNWLIITGQGLTSEEALDAITGNGDPLFNVKRNILNVCFNDNDNALSRTFTGTQTQTGVIPPPTPPPTPPEEPQDLAVSNLNDNDVSILLGNGDGTFGPKTDFPVGNNAFSVAVGNFN